MITLEETLLESALEQEQRTMQRQTLLKKLWELQQSRADKEKIAAVADEADGRAPCVGRSNPRLTSPAPRSNEAAALQA